MVCLRKDKKYLLLVPDFHLAIQKVNYLSFVCTELVHKFQRNINISSLFSALAKLKLLLFTIFYCLAVRLCEPKFFFLSVLTFNRSIILMNVGVEEF